MGMQYSMGHAICPLSFRSRERMNQLFARLFFQQQIVGGALMLPESMAVVLRYRGKVIRKYCTGSTWLVPFIPLLAFMVLAVRATAMAARNGGS